MTGTSSKALRPQTYRMMWAFWHILMMHAPAAAINPVGGPVLTKRFSAQELYAFAVAQ